MIAWTLDMRAARQVLIWAGVAQFPHGRGQRVAGTTKVCRNVSAVSGSFRTLALPLLPRIAFKLMLELGIQWLFRLTRSPRS